jgi:hypothetical protein
MPRATSPATRWSWTAAGPRAEPSLFSAPIDFPRARSHPAPVRPEIGTGCRRRRPRVAARLAERMRRHQRTGLAAARRPPRWIARPAGGPDLPGHQPAAESALRGCPSARGGAVRQPGRRARVAAVGAGQRRADRDSLRRPQLRRVLDHRRAGDRLRAHEAGQGGFQRGRPSRSSPAPGTRTSTRAFSRTAWRSPPGAARRWRSGASCSAGVSASAPASSGSPATASPRLK